MLLQLGKNELHRQIELLVRGRLVELSLEAPEGLPLLLADEQLMTTLFKNLL